MLNFVRSRASDYSQCVTAVRIAFACFLVVAAAGIVWGQPQPATPALRTATFNVFLRSSPVGFERVDVLRTDDGWIIRSTGELSPPFDLRNRQFEVEYDARWTPRRLSMEGSRIGREFSLHTTVEDETAENQFTDGGATIGSTDQIDPASVVLPDYFFGAYEAVAARLTTAVVGDRIPVYVAPRGQTQALVREMDAQDLQTSDQRLSARIYRITFENTDQPLEAEVWVDSDDRLLRVLLPAISLDVARQDISLVSTRLAGVTVPGDEQVRVAATGFSLAGTLTTPTNGEPPAEGWPAVVLVPGTASTDRDEYLSGVPLHGQLATILSASGHVVLRYDRRGVGQSGGRPESATLRNYAEDVRDVVRYVGGLDNVDRDRVAVIAHGEGGWIGLEAASRERRIAALVLMATPSTTGSKWVLEQQQAVLERLALPPTERDERADLQRRINAAVLDDGSWDDIPADMRSRADTPWFQSFLEFEPERAVRRSRQPFLLLHGTLDRQIPPTHADQLATFAQERGRRESTVALVHLDNINHLMVPVNTSAVGKTDPLNVSSTELGESVTATLTEWLQRTLQPTN
jgi:pimeloyl-ACP methyl ester carboxylesterase